MKPSRENYINLRVILKKEHGKLVTKCGGEREVESTRHLAWRPEWLLETLR